MNRLEPVLEALTLFIKHSDDCIDTRNICSVSTEKIISVLDKQNGWKRLSYQLNSLIC